MNRTMLSAALLLILFITPGASAQQYGYPPPPGYDAAPGWPAQRMDPWIEMRRMENEMRRRQWHMEREMERMERDMRAQSDRWDSNSSGIHIQESFSSPRIAIDEDDASYIVTAQIPGAEEKTIEVEQRGNRLRIAAMRQVEKRETSEGKRMQASFSSRYQRILTLPGPVSEGGMQTDFNDEVLTIRIPKAGS
ncbi:MAG: Hsp20/alpha crystallin family protein [Gammaproteobacteria bacterium]